MIYKKQKLQRRMKEQGKSFMPSSSIDLSNVEVDQEIAYRSICVYGVKGDAEKFKRKLRKCGNIDKIVEDVDVLRATFSSAKEAEVAVTNYSEKKGANGFPLVVCQDLVPPILVAGHKPDLFVIKDVPDEISIPQLWVALEGDKCSISHISFLATTHRHVIIQCKVKDGQQFLLEKNGTRLDNWRVKVELWFEFCFHMTRRNVLLIENIDQDVSDSMLKQLIGTPDGVEYIQMIESHHCALVYCQSKSTVDFIRNFEQQQLKISVYQKVAGLRYMAFLDNLHETTKDHDIMRFLRNCGNVLKVNVSLENETGLKKAVAYFEEEEGVTNAIGLSGTDLLGHTVAVSSSLKKSSANAVYITNLHRGVTALHLCLLFQECGHINSVHIPKQKNIVNLRQAAVVVFRDAESVPRALEKSNKSKVRGMRIVVHQEDPYENRGKRGKSHSKNKSLSEEESDKSGKRKNRRDSNIQLSKKKLKTV